MDLQISFHCDNSDIFNWTLKPFGKVFEAESSTKIPLLADDPFKLFTLYFDEYSFNRTITSIPQHFFGFTCDIIMYILSHPLLIIRCNYHINSKQLLFLHCTNLVLHLPFNHPILCLTLSYFLSQLLFLEHACTDKSTFGNIRRGSFTFFLFTPHPLPHEDSPYKDT